MVEYFLKWWHQCDVAHIVSTPDFMIELAKVGAYGSYVWCETQRRNHNKLRKKVTRDGNYRDISNKSLINIAKQAIIHAIMGGHHQLVDYLEETYGKYFVNSRGRDAIFAHLESLNYFSNVDTISSDLRGMRDNIINTKEVNQYEESKQ